MSFKLILTLVFILFVISLMFLYFVPLNTFNFTTTGNSNFSIVTNESQMQFYPNMRFPESEISYKVLDCPLQKKNDMEYAFSIMENLTSLSFYPVDNNEEISVTCEQKNKVNGEFFIAGEGGPTNVTIIGDFYVIMNGEILLIKQSDCPNPNVALHELFHVLGFEHSTNPDNVMYNVTKCDQTIGEDMIQLINKLYSIPSAPDLAFSNVSAVMNGRFLDINMTITNVGLHNADEAKIIIYGDEKKIKEIDLEPLEMGYGRFISMGNIFVSQIKVDELELVIDSNFNEINKENNKIKLKIKK